MLIEPTIKTSTDENESKPKYKSSGLLWLILSVILLSLLFGYLWLTNQPAKYFPLNEPLVIEEGLSAREIIFDLADQQYVNSATWLYLALSFSFGAENIKAGIYDIKTPLTTYALARLITDSAPPSATVALTFPEGYSSAEYAKIAERALANFDANVFSNLAKSSEGKLFPDTYAVPPNYSETELFELLLNTYEQKISPLRSEMENHKLTEEEIINLASIVEREANTIESMRLVAGILDTRLALGMPLQADATMEYVLNKPLKELTAADLEIDSPYNSYFYRGLPPTPIGNPGLDSIMAVINPQASKYLFYITDDDGQFHYAETYDKHRQNIARYLQ